MSVLMNPEVPASLDVVRVRHPLKIRLLAVARVETVTPYLVRVTLTGEDLRDFISLSFDDHVKVFFPAPGTHDPVLPALGPQGPVFPAGVRPDARDFTPCRFDRERLELDLEFALHEAGPATVWARQATVGQTLGIGGPRGSMIIPVGFDWHLLVGDDTALPAIARRLAELPARTKVYAVLEVEDPSAHVAFETKADLSLIWCYRRGALSQQEILLQMVRAVQLPVGEGYAWAAGESASIRAVRAHLVSERGMPKSRIRASSYWKRGSDATHEHFDD